MSARPRTSTEELLSAQLRRRTRDAHLSAEQAFDLAAGLADRAGYTALLGRLRGFYHPAEAALQHVSGWAGLDPPIDVGAHGRIELLDADLERLGSTRPSGQREMDLPVLGSLAVGLGWLYVLEGSALGGRVIANQARGALGNDLPISFFSSAGRPTGRNWRDLQHGLDAFGQARGPVAAEQVVNAATTCFERFGQWIGGKYS